MILSRSSCVLTISVLFVCCSQCQSNRHGNLNRHNTYSERLNRVRYPTMSNRNGLHAANALGKAYGVALTSMTRGVGEEGNCANDMALLQTAAGKGEPWATKVFDAFGKEPSGMQENPTLNWLGEFDECMGIEPVAKVTIDNQTEVYTPFLTQYCAVAFNITALNPVANEPLYLNIGFCVPDSCNTSETVEIAKFLGATVPILKGMPPVYATCPERSLPLDSKAKAVIAVCAVFLAVIVLATGYDVIIQLFLSGPAHSTDEKQTKLVRSYGGTANGGPLTQGKLPGPEDYTEDTRPLLTDLLSSNSQAAATSHHSYDVGKVPDVKTETSTYKPGLAGRLLLAFSVYTNAAKLLNTRQPPGTLTSVNGIRLITMTWVILGHTFVFGESLTRNFGTYFLKLIKRFTYQAIANETVAVDTFFVLSGLLVSYLTLKEIKKRKGPARFNWGLFYFHRFWRLTPPYMFVLMVYVPLIKYWGDGPLWRQTGIEKDECRDSWWRNLLYINNFHKTDEMCMGWSWYLANDMQFYVISPLILVPFFYSGVAGSALCLLLVLANLITTGVISRHYNFSAQIKLDSPPDTHNSFDKIYVKPYTRIAPYAIGLLAGYILYKTDCKIDIPKGKNQHSTRRLYRMLNTLGWATATALALLVIYAPYTSDGKYNMSKDESAFYNACFRTAWGLAIAWVVLACAMGYGGPVNALLSWPALIPLSRLTYCAYLVHPVVMDVFYMSQRQLIYWMDINIIYEFLGHLCMSYGVAFVVSLAFESPMMGLEKVLLGRDKRS